MNLGSPLGLDADALGRAFPFHLRLDEALVIRSVGRSLAKALPGIEPGAPLDRHFEVRRPRAATDAAAFRRHGTQLCTLRARARPELTLRGGAEAAADGGITLLVAPVITTLEALRELGLGFDDFATHDAVGELLLAARGAQMSLLDAQRLATRLQARGQQLDTILELGSNGVASFDADGLLQHANSALLELLSLSREATVGLTLQALQRHLESLVDPAAPVGPVFGAFDDDAMPANTLRLVVPRPSTLRVTARRAPDGGFVFYLRDVTAEAEVDRMKSEFLSTAAHELRTPMVSIFGFTELLLSRPLPEERRRDVLETIHRQTSLLIHMVNELLDLARIEARQGKDLRREPVSVQQLVDDTVAGTQALLATRRLEVDLRHGDRQLVLDAAKTVRALTNVLSNACKYSAADAGVVLRSLDGEIDGAPAIGLEVADRGIGMTEVQLARVFERFYRADPSGNIPGTGLGMSLVKEIVELQQGRVQVASRPGEGTTVTLWFRCAAASP